MNVNTLTLIGHDLPLPLQNIPSPPKQLYWIGATPADLLNRPKVAIVGSRKFTAYGRQITYDLAFRLARAGVLIISGLALGIDAIAHKAALDAKGLTMAVLASGIDDFTPRSHRQLADDILKSGGAIASEYGPGASVHLANFVIRNRIVSGLADGLLITEAIAASGTMHTARFALEQGKTVMAIPGNINSQSSEGTNNLIKAGAIPVTDIKDIFFALKIKPADSSKNLNFKGSRLERQIFKLISEGVSDQEELAQQAKLEIQQLSSVLTMLEINGYIKPLGAGQWTNT